MTAIEIRPFDPVANQMPLPRRVRAKARPVLASGAVAVVVVLLDRFVLPMVLLATNGTAAAHAGGVVANTADIRADSQVWWSGDPRQPDPRLAC